MNNVIFALAATTVLLFSSCKKDNDNVEPRVLGETADRSIALFAVASPWTHVKSWTASERDGMKVYSTQIADARVTNDILSKGAVVAFVKGTDFSGGHFPFEPNMIPWDQFIPWERMAYPYHWTPDIKEGLIEVTIRMHPDIEADYLKHRDKVQTRYFILSEAFLKQHNWTQQSLKEQSYKQLVTKTGTTP